ncbi:MAG: propionyl-CoA synthetase [Micrococcales bacterium]|nr:MAG: propionyl-CoA synthetase [Micrococcales bacterium]
METTPSAGAAPKLPEGAYRDAYQDSVTDPNGFWGAAADAVTWIKKPTTVLDESNPPFYRWFTGGTLNVCYNAVDRHVADGRADQPALIYDSPVTGTKATLTYAQLLEQVARFAGVLRSMGVGKGDRVVIYMPMVPESMVAMMACARLGAVHSVVFGGFAARELAARIDDAQPTVVVCASCGVETARVVEYKPLLDQALEMAEHTPGGVVVLQRPQARAELVEGRDVDWETMMKPGVVEPAECVEVEATDPLYILYTSGTTGKPKGIVRDGGGYAVAMTWSMRNIYDVKPGEVMFTASDIGWVVGHSYIIYAPLLIGATTIMFEGKPIGVPDAGTFWRVVNEHGVTTMFTAPTAMRAIKKEDPEGKLKLNYDISCLRTLFLAGERLDPDTYHWAHDLLGIPVIDNWWQTETGWPIAANPFGLQPGLPIKAGSPSLPVPGYQVEVLDSAGRRLPANTEGAVCIKLPLAPGTLVTLWGDDERYVSGYLSTFDGYYLSGDGGFMDEDGYVYILGRTDDVINVAGHRLSTGSLEAALSGHPAVAECAVIGVADQMKGQVPRGFIVLKGDGDSDPQTVIEECVARVRAEVGAVASLRQVDIIKALPKTRSGKILRKTMREIADGAANPTVPSTIEDLTVLEDLAPVLQR